MERGGSCPEDQGHVLQFMQKLREVFDVCDEDADGVINVEHFINLGQQFAHGDEIEKLVKYLDPNELGSINFKDFCHGVLAIKGCNELLKGVLGVNSKKIQHYPAQYVDYYYQDSHALDTMMMSSDGLTFPLGFPGFRVFRKYLVKEQ